LSCDGPQLPPVPTPGTTPGALDFVIALRTKDWGDHVEGGIPTYLHLGFDLDGVCTRSSATASCQSPPGAALADFTDGAGGIDNASGRFSSTWRTTPISDEIRRVEDSGQAANLLRVRGYNGEANDDQVEVSMLVGTVWPSSKPSSIKPLWDGSDTWSTTSAFVEDGALDKPLNVDKNAYVNDHTLVAHFASAVLGGPFTNFSTVDGVVLSGKLVAQGAGYALENGVRAGRWPAGGFFAFLTILIAGTPCALTQYSAQYDVYLKAKRACALTDIRSEGDDTSMPCDALSFGASLDGVPAKIGDVLPIEPGPVCPAVSCSSDDGGLAPHETLRLDAATPLSE
jgi:hypothetical protein